MGSVPVGGEILVRQASWCECSGCKSRRRERLADFQLSGSCHYHLADQKMRDLKVTNIRLLTTSTPGTRYGFVATERAPAAAARAARQQSRGPLMCPRSLFDILAVNMKS